MEWVAASDNQDSRERERQLVLRDRLHARLRANENQLLRPIEDDVHDVTGKG